jgi:glutathione S-transferase
VPSLYAEISEYDPLISNLAIQEYLVDKYDKEHKLSFPAGTNEYYSTKQWMYFQVSGQGPYYGQAWYISFLPFACR